MGVRLQAYAIDEKSLLAIPGCRDLEMALDLASKAAGEGFSSEEVLQSNPFGQATLELIFKGSWKHLYIGFVAEEICRRLGGRLLGDEWPLGAYSETWRLGGDFGLPQSILDFVFAMMVGRSPEGELLGDLRSEMEMAPCYFKRFDAKAVCEEIFACPKIEEGSLPSDIYDTLIASLGDLLDRDVNDSDMYYFTFR